MSIRRLCASLSAALLLGIPHLQASPVADAIEKQFSDLDAQLSELARRNDVIRGSLKAVDALFEQYLPRHRSIITLIRVNSRGQVINETTTTGTPGQKFRDVSRQGWFSVASDMKPYYGYVRSGGSYELFWAKPLILRGGSAAARSGGAILARIDLEHVLQSAAAQVEHPFALSFDGTRLYDGGIGAANPVTQQVAVKGLEGAQLLLAPRQQGTPSGKDAPLPAATPPPAQTAPEVAQPAAQEEKLQAPVPLSRFMPVIIIVFVIVAAAFVASWFQKREQRRQEELMARIEGKPVRSDSPGTPPRPAPSAPAPPPRQYPSPPVQGGNAPAPGPAFVPPPPAHPVPGGHPAAPHPAPFTPPAPPPPTGTFPAASGPEVYERIRQELYAELLPRIRAQVEQEVAAGTRSIGNKTRVLARTLQSHMEELTVQVNEANRHYAQLTSAVQNTSMRIREAIEGFDRTP